MKNVGEKSTKSFLLDFGLTDKEVTIYLTLLKVGPSTIMDLARETGIKRSTTHNNVEELIKKGLVSQTNYGERRMVIAEDPEKLKFLMEQKKWDMKKLEDNLPTAIKSIMDSVPQAKENTEVEVKYYKGAKEVWYVYEQSFKAESYYSFADLEKFYAIYPDAKENWNKSFTSNPKREVWDILVDSNLAKKNKDDNEFEKYHIKLLPKNDVFSSFGFADYIIFDNSLAIIQLERDNVVATVINSAPIAASLRALHTMMWELIPNK